MNRPGRFSAPRLSPVGDSCATGGVQRVSPVVRFTKAGHENYCCRNRAVPAKRRYQKLFTNIHLRISDLPVGEEALVALMANVCAGTQGASSDKEWIQREEAGRLVHRASDDGRRQMPQPRAHETRRLCSAQRTPESSRFGWIGSHHRGMGGRVRSGIRRNIRHSPLPSQKKFHDSNARFKGFSGPIGSGKSQALCQEAIRLTYQNPGRTGLIGAPTYPMLKDATLASLLECLYESEVPFELYKAENVISHGGYGFEDPAARRR